MRAHACHHPAVGSARNPTPSLYVHVRHPLGVRVRQEQAQAAQDGGRPGLCQRAGGADVVKKLAACTHARVCMCVSMRVRVVCVHARAFARMSVCVCVQACNTVRDCVSTHRSWCMSLCARAPLCGHTGRWHHPSQRGAPASISKTNSQAHMRKRKRKHNGAATRRRRD